MGSHDAVGTLNVDGSSCLPHGRPQIIGLVSKGPVRANPLVKNDGWQELKNVTWGPVSSRTGLCRGVAPKNGESCPLDS